MLLTNFLSSTTTLSWQARGANTCRGSGNRGSFSPGAAAKMMALLRVWATPYCPACNRGMDVVGLGSVYPASLFMGNQNLEAGNTPTTHQMTLQLTSKSSLPVSQRQVTGKTPIWLNGNNPRLQ